MANNIMDTDGTRPSQATSSDTTHPHRREPVDARKRPRSRTIVIGFLIFSILGAIFLAVALPAAAYVYYQINGRIIPGVNVVGLDLGGLTWLEAKSGLEVVYPQDMEILITDGTRTWKGRTADFGVGWDTEAMAQEALNVAHGKGLTTELSEMLDSVLHGWQIEPISYFDIETARIELLKWEATVNIPARDAELRINGGEVEILPSERGLALDIEDTLSRLLEDPAALLEQGELSLVTRPQDPEITDLSLIKNQVEEILNSRIIIQAYDPILDENYEWEVGREKISSWLGVQKTEVGYEMFLLENMIDDFARELISSLNVDQYLEFEEVVAAIRNAMDGVVGDPLRVYHHETSYTVKPGDSLLEIGWELGFPFWMIVEANPYLYSSPLEYGQEIVIPSRDTLIPLPVIPNKRIVISITDQRLRAYQDGEELWEFIISTGIDDSPTQPGVFQVRTHELNAYASVWDLYMPHFMGVYEAWPEFMNGIHGLPMLSSGRRLWANVLGRPASYGCIILTLEDAERLYNWAEDGVVVEILE
jgi:hypothetical protein